MTGAAEEDSHGEPRRARWLLLRGLAREARHWGRFPAILSEALRGTGHDADVETIDLPGTGACIDQPAPLSIDATATAVRDHWMARSALERANAPPTRNYLLAISLGGMVANAWTTRWPADFAGCVMINTSLRGYAPFYRRLRPSAYVPLAAILSKSDALARERAIVSLVSNRPDLHAETARDWSAIARDRPVRRTTLARQLCAAATYRPQRPTRPTLVLGSLGDRLVHPVCSQAIASRWQTNLRLHPDAGHDLPLDEPDWVAVQICNWMTSHDRSHDPA